MTAELAAKAKSFPTSLFCRLFPPHAAPQKASAPVH
jgi:hypothetical protein